MDALVAKETIMRLYTSLSQLRGAVDATVEKLKQSAQFELAERVAYNYPLLDKQMELANTLSETLKYKNYIEELNDDEAELINGITKRISALSEMIRSDSRDILEEVTTGKKPERVMH